MRKLYLMLAAFIMLAANTFAQEGLAAYSVARNTGITYTSISGTGTSAAFWRNTASVSTDDNLSEAIPIGFNFLYDGVNIGYVQFSTNGFLTLLTNSGATGSGTGTTPYSFTNSVFSLANGTVRTIAPFYDDQQTAGNLGTLVDLSASMKYQLTGSAPNRVFTVEWINMQDFATASTASLNYQVQLFEGSNNIRFGYGTMTPGAATWSYTAGLNSRILATTTNPAHLFSQQTANTATFGGAASDALATIPASNTEIIFTYGGVAPVPMSGPYSVPGSFATVKAAIDALNYNGTNGAITINLAAGSTFTEDLPPLQTGMFTNPITIQKSGAGANPVIRPTWTAAGTADYGFRMFGVDNLTWDGVDIASNGSNVEFGLFLSQLSDKNGCQNNTFTNFNVTLSRTGTVGQVGILMNSAAQAALSAAGANAGNVFKNFNIRNIAGGGIQFNGATAGTYNFAAQTIFLDNNNQITNDVCTNFNNIGDPATPNDLIPVTTSVVYGIFNLGQRDMTISNCNISNLTTSSTGAVHGIIPNGTSTAQMPSAALFSQGVIRIFNNKIFTLRANNTSAGIVSGIRANINGNAGSSVRMYNNFIGDLSSTSTATSTRRIIGIQLQDAGTGAGSAMEVWHNSISINPAGIACSNSCLEALTAGTGPVFTVRNNIFANLTAAQAGAAKHYCIASNSATLFGNTGSISNNNDLYVANTTNGFTGITSTTDQATIANWTAANGQDAASVTVNPGYGSATDLHMSALALNSSGTTAPAYITNDIDCQVRPLPAATNFDIGADEIDACSGTPTAGTISAALNPLCAGNTGTTLSNTGASGGAGITHAWGFSTVSGGPYTALGTSSTQPTGPLSVTTYYVDTVKCSLSGLFAVTVEYAVVVNAKPTVPVTPAGPVAICAPGTQLLDASGTNASTPAFQWLNNNAPISGANSATYTATASGSYRVRVQDGVTGCFDTSAAVSVTINPAPSAVSITPSAPVICLGNSVSLTAGGGTIGSAGNATLGTGTGLTSATAQPTAFCNRWAQYWNQTIYTAAELSAAGLTAGSSITSVTYTTTSQGDAANNTNFSIRIGNTANSVFTAFQTTGLSVVYGPATYVHAIGSNTITFTSPFTWDGTSNIVLDVRQDGVDNTNNAITTFTTAPDNKNIEAHTSTTSGTTPLQTLVANATVIPTASTTRLNIVLAFAPSATPTWAWTPATNLNTTTGPTVIASPTGTITYTATATAGGCTTPGTVTVTVTPPTSPNGLAGMPTPGATVEWAETHDVGNGQNYVEAASCDLISKVAPSGGSPVSGSIRSAVRVDSGANKMGTGALYAARFYAIEPAVSPATSTATVTLYYLQSEFDNYNLKALDSAQYALPTGPGDAVGISNLIIRQFHGTPTGGYRPGNYAGANEDLDPADVDVVWNAGASRWEVTVPVSSFSGFFLTSKVVVVPVRLLNIRGDVTGNTNTISWTTSQEQNNRKFIIERSTDGRNFTAIGETASRALNGTSSTPLSYSFVDALPVTGKSYYRLQMVSMNGSNEQSPVVTLLRGKGSFEIVDVRPNPTTSTVYFNVIGSNSAITVVVRSLDGKQVARTSLSQSNTFSINLGGLASGMYMLEATDRNGEKATYKIVKQ